MPIALIAAAAGSKQVIGKDGDLPWHILSDLKFFKEKTLGHTVLMGRVTYDSILQRLGKPLPNRMNIVLTRDSTFKDDRVRVITDIASLDVPANEWLYVIGGASVYEQMLPFADLIYLTHIDQEVEGDAFFPILDPKAWKFGEERVEMEKDVRLRFCVYKKI